MFERADGNWGDALELAQRGVRQGPGLALVADLTAAFDKHIWPARAQPSTRSKNWRSWSRVVTWAIARDVVDLLLPMDISTLKALTWDFMCAGGSFSTLRALTDAVQSRHRFYGVEPPHLRAGGVQGVDSLLVLRDGQAPQLEAAYPQEHRRLLARLAPDVSG
jgi:hypothetical protein